jgi:hypothetical protein
VKPSMGAAGQAHKCYKSEYQLEANGHIFRNDWRNQEITLIDPSEGPHGQSGEIRRLQSTEIVNSLEAC